MVYYGRSFVCSSTSGSHSYECVSTQYVGSSASDIELNEALIHLF